MTVDEYCVELVDDHPTTVPTWCDVDDTQAYTETTLHGSSVTHSLSHTHRPRYCGSVVRRRRLVAGSSSSVDVRRSTLDLDLEDDDLDLDVDLEDDDDDDRDMVSVFCCNRAQRDPPASISVCLQSATFTCVTCTFKIKYTIQQ